MSARVSATEAASIVGCSESFIRKLIKRGDLASAKKVDGRWSIEREDLARIDVGAPVRTIRTDEPHVRTAHANEADVRSVHANRTDEPREPNMSGWRDDLLAQAARLEADKVEIREEFDIRLTELRQESGLRIDASKARIIDLERASTVRESRIADMETTHAREVSYLRGQVAVLEAKVRETLEAHTEKLGDLASDIAELANAKAQMELRVYELEPVASQVPALQAAVDEKDASLSDRERELELREHELNNVREDIEAIASRPVTGSVFRLLTKKRLRI
jgi:chromosome segregation ATPase